MKKLLLVLPLILVGCAHLSSVTRDPVIVAGTNEPPVIAYRETRASVYTFFDSQSAVTKFQNRGQLTTSNEWASGTSIGSLNQAASGTNFNDLVGTIASSVASGVVKGMK